uniref:chloroplast envelope membrane protein n=1 Tax=Ceratopteris thalictroides TaxID=29596 RepID=UPI001FAF9C00|nr:chloroplast envelope membrane protein [Ceratopteris thalictroides]YP_010487952.1 chloroplast envelope membrane protein [Ceratopteris pteridoides]UJH19118.1 chloroplast envelope membrane protein [Ceratopteris thalictroides]UWI72054.1 chloroplast envelope membrane protein [Ceratopteris pteridoides]
MKSYRWKQKIIRWILNTPYRSLDRAYKTSKYLQFHSLCFTQLKSTFSAGKELSRVQQLFGIAMSHLSRYVIYFSLLEYKLSLVFLESKNKNVQDCFSDEDPLFFSKQAIRILFPFYKQLSKIENCFKTQLLKSLTYTKKNNIFSRSFFSNYFMNSNEVDTQNKEFTKFSENQIEEDSTYASNWVDYKVNNSKKMNRKLAWIEATSNEFDFRKNCFFKQKIWYQTEKNSIENYLNLSIYRHRSVPYESISLIPRSVTRTLSKFKLELTNKSTVLVQNEFDLAKNQASVSLQYIWLSVLLSLFFRVAIKHWFLEPWIRRWWNILQIQVFLNSLQEEKALKQLREGEALLWLNDIIGNLSDRQFQNFDAAVCNETTKLAMMYNEPNIQLILQLVTNTISLTFLVFLFLSGRKRLAVLNSRIQESFYSLNDTMKAFFILLLTDLCVGFHSPHGWEILVVSFFKQFGLIPNKYVISCFVSTFPVLLDTVFKYWIFRHLNRTSPSIVVTYHTMGE